MLFQIKGRRVEFEHTIRETHRRLRTWFFRWLVANRPQNLITGPVKHARRVLGTYARYRRFLDYGVAEGYETRLEAFRVALGGTT